MIDDLKDYSFSADNAPAFQDSPALSVPDSEDSGVWPILAALVLAGAKLAAAYLDMWTFRNITKIVLLFDTLTFFGALLIVSRPRLAPTSRRAKASNAVAIVAGSLYTVLICGQLSWHLLYHRQTELLAQARIEWHEREQGRFSRIADLRSQIEGRKSAEIARNVEVLSAERELRESQKRANDSQRALRQFEAAQRRAFQKTANERRRIMTASPTVTLKSSLPGRQNFFAPGFLYDGALVLGADLAPLLKVGPLAIPTPTPASDPAEVELATLATPEPEPESENSMKARWVKLFYFIALSQLLVTLGGVALVKAIEPRKAKAVSVLIPITRRLSAAATTYLDAHVKGVEHRAQDFYARQTQILRQNPPRNSLKAAQENSLSPDRVAEFTIDSEEEKGADFERERERNPPQSAAFDLSAASPPQSAAESEVSAASAQVYETSLLKTPPRPQGDRVGAAESSTDSVLLESAAFSAAPDQGEAENRRESAAAEAEESEHNTAEGDTFVLSAADWESLALPDPPEGLCVTYTASEGSLTARTADRSRKFIAYLGKKAFAELQQLSLADRSKKYLEIINEAKRKKGLA